jgi:hypothetical protein
MTTLAERDGTWTGTNGFRLMPTDEMAEFPATLEVRHGAGGHLTCIAYSWRHPTDGPQEGLLTVGAADDSGRLTALWGDSWHQQPTSMTLAGDAAEAGDFSLEGEYGGGWGWRIAVRTDGPDTVRLRMDNVIPAEHATPDVAAGPYPVMEMVLRRT